MDTGRLKSRKFWITIAAGFVVLILQELGVNINNEQLWGFITLVTGYNIGQGIADRGKS